MKRRFFVLLNVTLILSLLVVSPAAAKNDQRGLQPGELVTYEQNIPINIVFIGYPQDTIDQEDVLDELPESYAPVVRYPQFYGLQGRDMGLQFNFDYHVTFAGRDLTNRFFRYLKQIGTTGKSTDFQHMYNNQENNILDVTNPVLYIDAPSVEKWLARNLHKSKKSYTVVFINWYSRPDFNFHVYTKTDEPDPDTGYNFGEIRASRKMIAWGGGHRRLWFYDLSAGPEAWTDNWNVDNPDLDENGTEDYRMPPIWEYDEDGYRDPSALSSDLGLVTRFVGINLLFTSSPLYDPLATAPGAGGKRIVHINMFEDDPNSQGTDWIDLAEVEAQFSSFQPYYDWEVNLVDYPLEGEALRAFRIFTGLDTSEDCWTDFGTPFAQLFCYFDLNRALYIPDYEEADYVAGIFAFNTTEANLGDQFGLLGFADDNWIDGTQTYVFEFDSAEYRDLGYGFTTTTVHEGGHHFGLSHPHDGYDSELGLDYGPADEFYFAWSGDESNTVMHYLGLSNGFGQFDRDNMYRYEMAGYLNWSNALLAEIQAHPDANDVRERIRVANRFAETALRKFDQWKYRQAAANARKAYVQLAKAAARLGIETPADAMMLVAPSMIPVHEGDPIRFPDN